MAGFSVPAIPSAPRPAVISSPSQRLYIPPASARIPVATVTKKRPRNIACILCNKQKKKCGLIRPCPRCVELKLPCTQPVKPEGFCYFTKKRKLDDEPPVFPGNLWTGMGRPQPCENQPQHLPSPSPTVSTVGTPQPSYTSISSYDDSASTDIPAGKASDAPNLNRPDSRIRPHSASPDRAFILTSMEESSSKLPSTWDMSLWDLLPPPEELSDEIVRDSKFAGVPIFGLEHPINERQLDPVTFGEPMDLGDDCVGGMGDLEIREINEIFGIDAGVATSGVALGADGGISWGPDWLNEVDLSNTDLDLNDVDLSNFDFPIDILTDIQLSLSFEQIVSQQSPPASPPPLPLGAEVESDVCPLAIS